jgi:hypothetical protein
VIVGNLGGESAGPSHVHRVLSSAHRFFKTSIKPALVRLLPSTAFLKSSSKSGGMGFTRAAALALAVVLWASCGGSAGFDEASIGAGERGKMLLVPNMELSGMREGGAIWGTGRRSQLSAPVGATQYAVE